MANKVYKYISRSRILFYLATCLLGIVLDRLVNKMLDSYMTISINFISKPDATANVTTTTEVVKESYGVPIFFVIAFLVIIGLVYTIVSGYLKEKKETIVSKVIDKKDLSLIASMKDHKAYYDKLSELVEKNDSLLSIQIYDFPVLPEPGTIAQGSDFVYKIKRVGGYSKRFFVTNCILYEEFSCPYEFYRKLYDILTVAKKIEEADDLLNSINPIDSIALSNSITGLIKEIQDSYLKIDDVNNIQEKHFFYYRSLLELFAMQEWIRDVIKKVPKRQRNSLKKAVVFTKTLLHCGDESEKIETVLKQGKRTGLLTTMFLGDLHVFGHENSTFKQNRSYFVMRSSKYSNKAYLFTYKPDNRIKKKKSVISKCEKLYNRIKLSVDV